MGGRAGALQETAVLGHVATYFQSQGYQVWYNPRGLGHLPIPTHQVAVAGRYPDLLAVDNAERVIAVEAKGEGGDLATGLGQALVYKKGAHYSFLAAPSAELPTMADSALTHGVGVIAVGDGQVLDCRWPFLEQPPRYLSDVQRELSILAARGDQSRRIGSSALVLNHPLHYLAPILLLNDDMPLPAIAAALESPDGWGLGGAVVRAPIEGTKILGLASENGGLLRLTDKGRLVKQMLRSVTSRESIAGVRSLTTRRPLIDEDPLLGGILRFLYLEDPDIRLLREHLRNSNGRLTLRQLLLELLRANPNIVLNVFCSQRGKELLIQHLLRGTEADALAPNVWPLWLMKRSYFQLKRQLIHVGVLQAHPARGGGRQADDLDGDIWELRF